MDKNQRMQELIEKLNEASKAYYGSGKEIMSNFEWDRLYDELVQLEGETGIVMANSPTVNVGELDAVLSGFEKVQHEISVKSWIKQRTWTPWLRLSEAVRES